MPNRSPRARAHPGRDRPRRRGTPPRRARTGRATGRSGRRHPLRSAPRPDCARSPAPRGREALPAGGPLADASLPPARPEPGLVSAPPSRPAAIRDAPSSPADRRRCAGFVRVPVMATVPGKLNVDQTYNDDYRGWPVAPVHEPHPIRGAFMDLRPDPELGAITTTASTSRCATTVPRRVPARADPPRVRDRERRDPPRHSTRSPGARRYRALPLRARGRLVKVGTRSTRATDRLELLRLLARPCRRMDLSPR